MASKDLKPRLNQEDLEDANALQRAKFELQRFMLRQEVLLYIINGNFDTDPHRFTQSLLGSNHPKMLTYYSIELIAKLSSGKSQYNPLGQMPQTSA